MDGATSTIALLLAAPCIGSFVGLVADRLPVGAPVVAGRSACDTCGTRLGPPDLVPVLSWLAMRGRCRHCGAPVGLRHPLVELAALAIAVAALWTLPGWLALAGSALGWALLALALIDARHMILPDVLTLPLIPCGLAVAYAVEPGMLPGHAVAAAVGYLGLAGVRAAYMRLRGHEGLGLGDAKLLAAAGAWVSWQGLPLVLLLAAASALAWTLAWTLAVGWRRGGLDARRPLAFGPWLAGALWAVWLSGTWRSGIWLADGWHGGMGVGAWSQGWP